MDSRRPDPDELLRRLAEEAHRADRGKLVIFFGAAPGVGKTYAMLQEAHAEKARGRDVVAGVVETHGRADTTALLAGLEVVPQRQVEYRGIALEEFDLDATLARRPGLVLVDELAHTNAEGSRHPKRWQDVAELLDAGIDVYSSLNVQHLESLNDVVAQITGVVVRERIPDSVLEEAHEIRLVDLPPDELLGRLQEGKVYVPEQARHATTRFFRRENLMALRELALQRTAARVDAQMQEARRDLGIERTWAVSERLLVCVSSSPHSARLVRAAFRMVQRPRSPWYAVYVETPATVNLPAADRARLSQNLRLAEQLGAEVATLSGLQAAEEVIRFARAKNVTKIVVGKQRYQRWRDRLFGTFADELIRHSGEIDLYVTAGETEPEERLRPARRRERPNWAGYATAVVIAAVITLLSEPIFGRQALADVVMLYLLGIVLVSMRFGFGPSLFGAVLSVLAFDFFFIPPYLTFAVADFRHVGTFAIMMMVAVVISGLTRRVRAQAEAARHREERTAALYSMSQELARTTEQQALIEVAVRHLGEVFDSTAVVFTPEEIGRFFPLIQQEAAAAGPDRDLVVEVGTVYWVWSNAQEAGLNTNTLPGGPGLYLPLTGSRGKVGVLGIFPRDRERFSDPEQRRLLSAFVTQVAMALERIRLMEERQQAFLKAEEEQIRSTLLSSVSHDLRTPLAAITGATSTLLEDDQTLAPSTRRDLLQAVYEETERLNRLVRNLLDMTRLESRSVTVDKAWQPLEEVVGAALQRMDTYLQGRPVQVELAGDLPLVPLDTVLMEQVLVNLIENALKYTPAGSPIEVRAKPADGEVVVEIADRGPGVPAGEEERIFDKLYRASRDRGARGVGLGLAICRAVVKLHGGRIWVESRPGGGAAFRFALPIGEPPPELRNGPLPEAAT